MTYLTSLEGHKPIRAVASANAAAFLCYNLHKIHNEVITWSY